MSEDTPRDLFDRLFRRKKPAPEPVRAPEPVPPPPPPVPVEALAPAPIPQPPSPPPTFAPPPAPTPVPEAPPGPPEATPDFVEEIEDDLVEEAEPVPDIVETPPPIPTEALAPAPTPTPAPSPRLGWFQRLTTGLRRTSDQLSDNLAAVFVKRRLDEATLEELEDVLIQADFGVDMAMSVTDALRAERFDRDVSMPEIRAVLADQIEEVLAPVALPLVIDGRQKPFVILVVGVNGTGKTTTIGKLALKLKEEGRSVMLAAGDTFRAAAIEQLQIWGSRTGAPVITRPAGSDASGLAFDAVTEAKAQGRDVLIIDTAGRLQNRDELMAELEKIIRVIRKVDATAPHAVLLTLDATTGQNALNQVEIFGQRAGVTGLVMTKLDSTARGGILVAIAHKHGLPVHFIGVGEGVEDLQPFRAADFASAIAGDAEKA